YACFLRVQRLGRDQAAPGVALAVGDYAGTAATAAHARDVVLSGQPGAFLGLGRQAAIAAAGDDDSLGACGNRRFVQVQPGILVVVDDVDPGQDFDAIQTE